MNILNNYIEVDGTEVPSLLQLSHCEVEAGPRLNATRQADEI